MVPVTCHKCSYVRRESDTAPAWQCPSCGIAYAKYAEYLRQAKHLVIPPKSGEEAPHVSLNGSVWSLVAANLLTLVIARYQHWPLASLMLIYWGQSVVIGGSYLLRILALEKFSTENFTINSEPVDPTPATKRKVAAFFVMHYGIFHAVYLGFILGNPHEPVLLDRWFWLCTAAFALNHAWSYRYNRDHDRQGTPNIGMLMFVPYLRVGPMHLTLIFGAALGKGGGLILFGALKTVADVMMHVFEHDKLQKPLDVNIG